MAWLKSMSSSDHLRPSRPWAHPPIEASNNTYWLTQFTRSSMARKVFRSIIMLVCLNSMLVAFLANSEFF